MVLFTLFHVAFVSFIVRPGQNFGVDYTLYRDSPSLCHSELCVLVLEDGASLPSWRQMMTLTRIVPDVMKLLVLCYVMKRDGGDKCASETLSNDRSSDGDTCPWPHALAAYSVRPVSTIIRRPGARSEPTTASIRDIQLKFCAKSRLAVPRKTRTTVKKRFYYWISFNCSVCVIDFGAQVSSSRRGDLCSTEESETCE